MHRFSTGKKTLALCRPACAPRHRSRRTRDNLLVIAKQRNGRGSPARENSRCTAPLEAKLIEILSDPTPASAPLWSTFCGNCAGEWHGSAIAYSPVTAMPEVMTLDEKSRKVFEMPCLTIEDRMVAEDGTDKLTRECYRACSPTDIASPEARAAARSDEESSVLCCDEEIVDDEDGLIIFEAGAYSLGPSVIGTAEGEKEAVTMLEQCLNWGGHERVRCQMLLSTIGGRDGSDIDVDVLRIVVFYETWAGPPGYCDVEGRACELSAEPRKAEAPVTSAREIEGRWKCFDVGSLPVIDNPDGKGERRVLAYFSSESSQEWELISEEVDERGICLWLPGRIAVSMAISPGFLHDDADGGLSIGGVVFSFGWMAKDGTWVGLEREYSGEGHLREVRSSTACRGGWVGGEM